MDAGTWIALAMVVAAFGIFGLAEGFGKWCEWQSRRFDFLKRRAFRLYVETGTETEAFHALSRRAVQAAERQRVAVLRERSCQTRHFQAESACPSCTRVGLHWIENTSDRHVIRQCRSCQHTWREEI